MFKLLFKYKFNANFSKLNKDEVTMFLKLAVSKNDLEQIVKLRKQVFVDELKVQDKDYQDIFNDHFSKNLMVIQNGQLVGAVRVVFDYHSQRFYISYLVTASSKRKKTIFALLVGGILHIMEVNRIQTIYADSHSQILEIYLKFGCEIIGKPRRKYGFHCEWTPIRYNFFQRKSVANWMLERARPFLSRQQCKWIYPIGLMEDTATLA